MGNDINNIEKDGARAAMILFHNAARHVPAYKKFLKTNGINPRRIKTFSDLSSIPVMDKRNYLHKYGLSQLFLDGRIPAMAYASSGSSGKPTFWFRGEAQEEKGARIHEIIFSKIFGIKKDEPTLVIVCFSMGIWIAGNYTLTACRRIASNGYAITVVTPGMERDDIFQIFMDLAPHFKNVVLAGYPPFLMDVIVAASSKKILPRRNFYVLTAGDKFSEEWRDSLCGLLRIKEPAESVVSIFGSADAGILGYETPLSIFVRRKAMINKNLYEKLFGDTDDVPALVQYNPRDIYFEEINGELIFTARTAAPLIRYNIHDTGRIIKYDELRKLLKVLHYEAEATHYGLNQWNLPFIVKKGRTDVAVTYYALNIYPENIKAGLEQRGVSKFVSGQFFAFNKTIRQGKKQKLFVEVELASKVKPSGKLLEEIRKSIVASLIKLNSEYRKLYSALGQAALPVLRLIPFGDQKRKSNRMGGVLFVAGKKSRILGPNNQ